MSVDGVPLVEVLEVDGPVGVATAPPAAVVNTARATDGWFRSWAV